MSVPLSHHLNQSCSPDFQVWGYIVSANQFETFDSKDAMGAKDSLFIFR